MPERRYPSDRARRRVERNRAAFIEALRAQPPTPARPRAIGAADHIRVAGGLLLQKVYRNGKVEVVVDDRNLVVSLGRKVMSRAIAGVPEDDNPTITETTRPALRVIRDTTGSPTSAHVEIAQVGGTNDYTFKGFVNDTTEEFSFQYTGGSKNLTTLAADIEGETGWNAEVLNSLGSTDATNLLETERGDCLGVGDPGDYDSAATSPNARILYALSTRDYLLTAQSEVTIDRMRFGTQGHIVNQPDTGKDVLATEERMVSELRPVDIGFDDEGEDWLAADATYPNTAVVTFEATLEGSQGNGFEISEAGLFTPMFMAAKKNFGTIQKTAGFSIEAQWSLVF